MINNHRIRFDAEIAKLVLASETGRIVTERGNPVEIIQWILDDPQAYSGYPIWGKILPEYSEDTWEPRPAAWTATGKYYGDHSSILDLLIEITDEETYELLKDGGF